MPCKHCWWWLVGSDRSERWYCHYRQKKDSNARAKIILHVDLTNYSDIKSTKTTAEAWNALKKDLWGLWTHTSCQFTVYIRILVTTQLSNCKSVDFYCDQIISTAHKLNEMGFEVNDEWVGTLLLAGLPDEYRPMIMGLESSGTKITGDSIKVKLLQNVKIDEVKSW